MGFNLIRTARDFFKGDYGEIIEDVSGGLGAKINKSKLEDIIGAAEKVDDVLDLVTGEAATKLAADRDFQLAMADKQAKSAKSFYDFLVATEQTTRTMPVVIQVLRGLIRPITTLAIVGFTIYMVYMNVVEGIPVGDNVWGLLKLANGIVLIFWFGSHGYERIVERMDSGGKFKNKIS